MIWSQDVVDVGMGLFLQMAQEMSQRRPATDTAYKNHFLAAIRLKHKVLTGSHLYHIAALMLDIGTMHSHRPQIGDYSYPCACDTADEQQDKDASVYTRRNHHNP